MSFFTNNLSFNSRASIARTLWPAEAEAGNNRKDGRRWPVLLLQVVEDPLQLSLLLRLHGDEDLGGAAGLAEGRALVQRLAVVLDQHVLVIAADTHTHTHTHTHQQVSEAAAVEQDCTTEEEESRNHSGDRERARAVILNCLLRRIFYFFFRATGLATLCQLWPIIHTQPRGVQGRRGGFN